MQRFPNSSSGVLPRRAGQWGVLFVSASVGLIVWWATMARYPRYSGLTTTGSTEELGSGWLFVTLPVLSVLGGALAYRSWIQVAEGLALPGLLLSPFTTPRGDNDGLWTLIVPMLVVLAGVMLLLSWAGARLRQRVQYRRYAHLPPPP